MSAPSKVGNAEPRAAYGEPARSTSNVALTARELDVLACAAGGLSSGGIAGQLSISPATVKRHFENIYAKLRVRDRTAAVAFALRAGLIE